MLNIEVIKFEAQDVITASGCICKNADVCFDDPNTGKHMCVFFENVDAEGNPTGEQPTRPCPASSHVHTPKG